MNTIKKQLQMIDDFIKTHCFYKQYSLYWKKYQTLEPIHLKSFSRISKGWIAPDLSHIPPKILKMAGIRGSAVHEAIEQTLQSGIKIFPEKKYQNYWIAFEKFCNDHKILPLAMELRVFDLDKLISGSIDFLGMLNNELVIIDWKTSAKINPMLTGMQLYIYKTMLAYNKINVDHLYICHLKKDGNYKLVKVKNEYFPLFEKVLVALLWLNNFPMVGTPEYKKNNKIAGDFKLMIDAE